MTTLHDFTVKDIKGNDWNLAELKGKVRREKKKKKDLGTMIKKG